MVIFAKDRRDERAHWLRHISQLQEKIGRLETKIEMMQKVANAEALSAALLKQATLVRAPRVERPRSATDPVPT